MLVPIAAATGWKVLSGMSLWAAVEPVAMAMCATAVTEGVVVTDLADGSTAANVGFQKGDIILAVNSQKIAKTNDLEKATRDSSRLWRIQIVRGGQQINVTLGVIPLPIPAIPLTVNISAFVEPYAYFDYEVALGIDTTGFYIDPTTHIGVGGGVRAGLEGSVDALGFIDLASLDLGVDLSVSSNAGLNDPDPSDGKIYLDEIYDGRDVAGSFLSAMRVELKGQADGFARAALSLPWPLPDITYRSGSRWPTRAAMELVGRDGKAHTLEIVPITGIPLNVGCGYGADPDWTHGVWKGDDWTEQSVYDHNDPAVSGRGAFSIVDHIARATFDGQVGWGIFEHGNIGRHDPSGFTDMMQVAD